MSEPTAKEASSLHDEGLLNVSDFLYVLRNDAGRAAEELMEAIRYMRDRLENAERTHTRLEILAGRAERAAEDEHFKERKENTDD